MMTDSGTASTIFSRKRREIFPSLRAEENQSMTIVENPISPLDLPVLSYPGAVCKPAPAAEEQFARTHNIDGKALDR
jgi:hypothetical protein